MVELKHAVAEDFDEIYALYGRNTDLLGPPFPAAIRLKIQEGEILIAVEDGNFLGFCNYHQMGLHTTVYEICVNELARGKGVGKQMVQFLIDCLHKPVQAKCVKDSTAEKFWSKIGRHLTDEPGKKRKLAVYRVEGQNTIKKRKLLEGF